MKLILFIGLLCLVPIVVKALDLAEAAHREKARRRAVLAARNREPVPRFDNEHLEHYRGLAPTQRIRVRSRSRAKPAPRDLVAERAHWLKEKQKHERELSQLDAKIGRLEWRLAERKARSRPGERLRDDPALRVIEESLKSLRDHRKRFEQAFRERARKAGAFPGWLR
ncbi:MAG: hypothetical protein ACE5JI_14370 [Acidobacteriota bacterium]